jgi:predicted transcriptional regulator
MTLKQRHQSTDKRLNKAAQAVINGQSARAWAEKTGKKYGYTGQTILNYLYGMGKDGFLKEALLQDLNNN